MSALLKYMKVFIRRPTFDDSSDLSEILCNDDVLRKDLSIPNSDFPTPESFLQKVSAWEVKFNSETYVIVADNQAVGTISLSQIDLDKESARIGYWVGAAFRNRGYCTKGFEELLKIAHIKGIKTVSAKIANANCSSSRIWNKLKAGKEKCEEGKTEFTLQLRTLNS